MKELEEIVMNDGSRYIINRIETLREEPIETIDIINYRLGISLLQNIALGDFKYEVNNSQKQW